MSSCLICSFSVEDLEVLLSCAKIKPVVNQILLHPYVVKTTQPLLDYLKAKDIVAEAYWTLHPLTQLPGGPVDEPVSRLAEKYKARPEQILLAWAKAKGWVIGDLKAADFSTVVITSSSRKDRLEGYMRVGDIYLTPEQVAEIDAAGAAGQKGGKTEHKAVNVAKVASGVAFGLYVIYQLCSAYGKCM